MLTNSHCRDDDATLHHDGLSKLSLLLLHHRDKERNLTVSGQRPTRLVLNPISISGLNHNHTAVGQCAHQISSCIGLISNVQTFGAILNHQLLWSKLLLHRLARLSILRLTSRLSILRLSVLGLASRLGIRGRGLRIVRSSHEHSSTQRSLSGVFHFTGYCVLCPMYSDRDGQVLP